MTANRVYPQVGRAQSALTSRCQDAVMVTVTQTSRHSKRKCVAPSASLAVRVSWKLSAFRALSASSSESKSTTTTRATWPSLAPGPMSASTLVVNERESRALLEGCCGALDSLRDQRRFG
jgi:hypothetical protein